MCVLTSVLPVQVYDVAIESGIDQPSVLSKSTGNTVLLKREDQQSVFSFKLRGAYNMVASLREDERQRGIICSR